MKTIVCFGDSNTWGAIPGLFSRYPRLSRWPGILQRLLGDRAYVIEEGLCGRTTCWDDPHHVNRNGVTHLPIVLETHAPTDLLVVMLGTNDLKWHLGRSAEEIAGGADKLLELASQFEPKIANILLVAPAHVVISDDRDSVTYFDGAIEKSKRLPRLYAEVAERYGCSFLDASAFVQCDRIDGIHLNEEAHRSLADAMQRRVGEIFGDEL